MPPSRPSVPARIVAALLAAVFASAAGIPCPGAPAIAAHASSEPVADGGQIDPHAGHGAHAGHAEATAHASHANSSTHDTRASNAENAPRYEAPCPCGCDRRSAAQLASFRLDPVALVAALDETPLQLQPLVAVQPSERLPLRAAAPEPVPI